MKYVLGKKKLKQKKNVYAKSTLKLANYSAKCDQRFVKVQCIKKLYLTKMTNKSLRKSKRKSKELELPKRQLRNQLLI